VDERSNGFPVALDDRRHASRLAVRQFDRKTLRVHVAALARQPVRKLERGIPECTAERVAKIDRSAAGLKLDDQPGDRPTRQPPLQHDRKHRNGDRGEDEGACPGRKRAERLADDVVRDRERQRPEHGATSPEQWRDRAPLRGTRSPPAIHEQRGREQREDESCAPLALQDGLPEVVVASDLERVVGATGAEHCRVHEEQVRDLDDDREDNRCEEEDALEAAAQPTARKREHEVDEAEQVDVLKCRPEREDHRVVAVGKERHKPGKADEDHHRPEEELGTVAPGGEAAADVGPADEKRQTRRRPGRRRLPVASND
jgi:hypothetical protein